MSYLDQLDANALAEHTGFLEPHRTRTLSQKAMDNYTSLCESHKQKLELTWKEIEAILCIPFEQERDILRLREFEKKLTRLYDKYKQQCFKFLTFLNRTGIQESTEESNVHLLMETLRETRVNKVNALLDNCIQQLMEKVSHHSKSSKRSKSSHSSNSKHSSALSVLAEKQVKAQAARAQTEYLLRETDLRKQQALINEQIQHSTAKATRQTAELNAELELLRLQKEVAVAEAEITVLQSVVTLNEASCHSHSQVSVPVDNPSERTKQYVLRHSTPPLPNISDPKIESKQEPVSAAAHGHKSTDRNMSHELEKPQKPAMPNLPVPGLNPYTPSFVPYSRAEDKPTVGLETTMASELTQFLLKKELLLTQFTSFTDKPEAYKIWKSGFLGIVNELKVSPREEMDLLVKWLGPESSQHAVSLRASNVHDPNKGLFRLWDRLDERYGSPEMIEAALKTKLHDFPRLSNKDNKKLYELSDLLAEIESIKEDEDYKSLLAYFDSSTGVIPIVSKLPYGLQDKWTTQALKYKKAHGVSFPPFSFFVDFVRDISKARNDPSFYYEGTTPAKSTHCKTSQPKNTVFTKKTDVDQQQPDRISDPISTCPLHKANHSLNMCKGFRTKPLDERKTLIKQYGVCYRCCASTEHLARACKDTVKCGECGTDKHPTALHVPTQAPRQKSPSTQAHGGEKSKETTGDSVQVVSSTKCTQVCGDRFNGKSCAKTVLVRVFPKGRKDKTALIYAILDDQSNASLVKPGLFDLLDIAGEVKSYTLSSCAGKVTAYGRRAHDCVVESLDGATSLDLPYLIECEDIPNIKQEIPTPQVAQAYPHLKELSDLIPPLNDQAEIMLLIGRDIPEAHHVIEQRTGPRNTPFAQKLSLGWTIIGESCLGKVHRPDLVTVNKTHTLADRRPSLFKPCPNQFKIQDIVADEICPLGDASAQIGRNVFNKTKDDEKWGLSIDDKEFLGLMDIEVYRNLEGNWVAPLPFRKPRERLPNNKPHALKRAGTLDKTLRKDPDKKQHMIEFMQRVFDSGHAEIAPPMEDGEECWYLPIFGIYHPKKPGQIRAVFDSSAKYNGISLNDVLLSGPDLTNSLLGILMRFRKEPVALTADIQQMFYCFIVTEEHRNYLRFLWYRDNDPQKELIDYRMRVHVFGNSPSPAVATYCLRRAVQSVETIYGKDVSEFVEKDFYVDDGVTSLPTAEQATDLMKRTKQALETGGNLRLHKIASNDPGVLSNFSSEDLAKELKDLALGVDDLPFQRSLGLIWDLKQDAFTFRISHEPKPYTKRGILSTVNSIFDPLGFIAPVVIRGKAFLRDLMPITEEWDQPLPPEHEERWNAWRDSLTSLESLYINRTYLDVPFNDASVREIHIYSDASEKAIAASAYLKTTDEEGNEHVSFILGKAKLAPTHATSIPRLELCAAVLAVEIGEVICDQLNVESDSIKFYTDSKVVLGYIYNQRRRFFVYVSNRVQRIRRSSKPDQWKYIPTQANPADQGTRSVPAPDIANSMWLLGPPALVNGNRTETSATYELTDPNKDTEIRPEVITMKSRSNELTALGSQRFERFSSWKSLVNSIATLKHIARSYHEPSSCKGWHVSRSCRTVDMYTEAERHIIREVQHEYFSEEISCIGTNTCLPRTSPLLNLDPMLDEAGLLRVGGRLRNAAVGLGERHPLIIPGRHYIATLLVRHHHHAVKHQGRHFTEGAVRAAGLWIIGGKRLISSVIHKCIQCRKLRGKTEHQKMSDLPEDRLHPAPPFTCVGMDVFGPWTILSRRTRGGQAESKRWAVIFSCLTTRAIHIEVVEDMSSSCFINALRRFIAIRGDVKEFRSDRGTNFVGAAKELGVNIINVEDTPVKHFLDNRRVVWRFNPPHSSHMGGAWERMIGLVRRILDAIMNETSKRNLTHDVLVTLMAEICAIVNGRPILPVSNDPEAPEILTPATLLTQKTGQVSSLNLECDLKDIYKSQWKRVQVLADAFWSRWQREYIHTLQTRRKWQTQRPDIKEDDVVLVVQKSAHRNDWPLGVITRVIPGSDDRIRKAEVRVIKDGSATTYIRPITEMILLLSDSSV